MKRNATLIVLGMLATLGQGFSFTPGNILVSEGNGGPSRPRTISEYTRTGVFVQRLFFPKNPNQDNSETNRDFTLDENGNLHLFDGTFNAGFTSMASATNALSQKLIAGLSVFGLSGMGKIASSGNFLFLTDHDTAGSPDIGIVRYDRSTGTIVRFGDKPVDLCVPADGLLYALIGTGSPSGFRIDVYNPATTSLVRSIDTMSAAAGRAIRSFCVDKQGFIYLADTFGTAFRLDSTGNILLSKAYTRSTSTNDINVSDDGVLLIAQEDGRINLLNASTLNEIRYFQTGTPNSSASYSLFVPSVNQLGFGLTAALAEVAGQAANQLTVTFNYKVNQAITVALSDNSSNIATPPNIEIPANQVSGQFDVNANAVNSDITVSVSAKVGANTKSVSFILKALVPVNLGLDPNPVVGGSSVNGTVTLNGLAGASGRIVSITDDSSFCTSPGNITVPAGANSGTFTLTTLPVSTVQNVTVRAAVSAGSTTASLQITP